MSSRETKKIRILIVDDVVETRENLKKLLYFEDDVEIVGTASNGRDGVEQATALRPDIVLMDINMPGMDGIAAGEQISTANPDAQVIMMSVQGESDYLRRSMLAGAREFLIKPFSSEELITSIRRVHQLAATRRAARPAPQATDPPPLQTPTVKLQTAKIIAVFSPKGGSGVSTIAANLAAALKEETKLRVAIIDASFQFGDVGVMLNLPSSHTIADLVTSKHDPDDELLNGIMASHSSGLRALLAPPRPETAELITTDLVRGILAVVSKQFDYVIVDTGKALNDQLLAILDAAEQIILVSTADIASLKSAKLFFEVEEALQYPASKTIMILNRYDGRSGISAKDIEGNIKHAVAGTILRDDRVATAALNRGIPFVLTQRGTPLSQAIFALARWTQRPAPVVVTAAPPAAKSKSPAASRGNIIDTLKPKRGGFFLFRRG